MDAISENPLPPGTYKVKLVNVVVSLEPHRMITLCKVIGGEYDGRILEMIHYNYKEVNDERNEVAEAATHGSRP